MQIEKGYIYHIYNQGNNRQKIFFERENYLFFLKKIKTHILPYVDILAWCLMPNHFHLMVLVNETELLFEQSHPMSPPHSQGLTQSQTLTKQNPDSVSSGSATSSRAPTKIARTNLNKEIGILLASYTRAINKQKGTTGSLFRSKTKAECLNKPEGITPSFFNIDGVTKINVQYPEMQYPQICFNYIHQNPVVANLVENEVDWEFSSAIDYAGLRDGKLVNKEIALQYIQFE